MSRSAEHLVKNRLMRMLSDDERTRLVPYLHYTKLSLGDVIYEPGARLDHLCFPTTSVVSLLYTMENGVTAEMGLAGNDGVVGIALFLGGDTTPNRAVVQLAGGAYQMPAEALRQEFARGGPLAQPSADLDPLVGEHR
ncbi:MAG: Crp/Fnr family transcriptional regulator [Acetobacteraceae bacterium]|nr:Crp/Fnr family transcriptional regulator [Acetobacteraceae bacterium]MBV8521223.1 Crp/Fnr family transcriptional regulator [Acetobacteraceae bacterium]